MTGNKHCIDYTGYACVNCCPIATMNDPDNFEYDFPTKKEEKEICKNCWYYEGCSDCILSDSCDHNGKSYHEVKSD